VVNRTLLVTGNKSIYLILLNYCENMMLSDVEKRNNLMLLRLTSVATFVADTK